MNNGLVDAGLSSLGLSIVCETCESDIDFPDDFADVGVCRHCGIAFLIDAPATAATRTA